jgi:CHASE3 domain sensor protein
MRPAHLKFYGSLRIIFLIIIVYNCYFYYVNLGKKHSKKQVKNKRQTLILLLTYHSIINFNIKPEQNDETNPSNSI